jgi:protein subunit release factor A
MAACVEVRPGEGGDDARLFARDLLRAYVRLSLRVG